MDRRTCFLCFLLPHFWVIVFGEVAHCGNRSVHPCTNQALIQELKRSEVACRAQVKTSCRLPWLRDLSRHTQIQVIKEGGSQGNTITAAIGWVTQSLWLAQLHQPFQRNKYIYQGQEKNLSCNVQNNRTTAMDIQTHLLCLFWRLNLLWTG